MKIVQKPQFLPAIALMLITLTPCPVQAFVHQRQAISIPMRDGQSLAADLYKPAAAGSWPVVLIQTPYNKNQFALVFLNNNLTEPLLKNPGYAFVVLDWRGFFSSAAAAYQGNPTRGQDGYDAVEWCASQGWSSGAIGTWGASALGTVQVLTAAQRPPHLRCCVPIQYHYIDTYDLAYPGGIYARNRDEFVYSTFGGMSVIRAHPLYDPYWQLLDSLSNASAFTVPMLHITGWYDHETDATIAQAFDIQDHGGTGAFGQQKVLIGPWSHGGAGDLQQGQLTYPAAQYVASLEAVDAFDFYLRNIANGYPSRPVLRTFEMNENAWRIGTRWPPDNPRVTYLLSAAGTLEPLMPTATGVYRTYTADPANPVPTLFGAVVGETTSQRGPGDLSSLETRPDVMTFTASSRVGSLHIEGRVRANLYVSLETPGLVDTDVMVRLMDVYPDGRSMLVVDAARRVSLRDSYQVKQYPATGQVVGVKVELPSVSIAIPASHRLRIQVSPSNYDRYDVNTQDGSNFSDDASAAKISGTLRLWCDRQHPASLEIPLRANTYVQPDLDFDGDVDAADLAIFQSCAGGPAQPYAADCRLPAQAGRIPADFDADADVDMDDFGTWQRCFSGEGIEAAAACGG